MRNGNASRILFRLLLVLMVVSCLCGCKDDDEPGTKLRPAFSVTKIEIEVGETLSCKILNATQVEAVTIPQCVDVSIDGVALRVTGLTPGSGDLLVNADGMRIRCHVIVMGVENPPTDEPESPEETASQLADASQRIESGIYKLDYSTTGTLFSIDTASTSSGILAQSAVIEAVNLTTGLAMSITFTQGIPVISEPEGDFIPVSIPLPEFKINDTEVPLKEAAVMCMKSSAANSAAQSCEEEAITLWIRAVTTENTPVWVVFDLPF